MTQIPSPSPEKYVRMHCNSRKRKEIGRCENLFLFHNAPASSQFWAVNYLQSRKMYQVHNPCLLKVDWFFRVYRGVTFWWPPRSLSSTQTGIRADELTALWRSTSCSQVTLALLGIAGNHHISKSWLLLWLIFKFQSFTFELNVLWICRKSASNSFGTSNLFF